MIPSKDELIRQTLEAWEKGSIEDLPVDIQASLRTGIRAIQKVESNGGLSSIGGGALAALAQKWGNASPKNSKSKPRRSSKKREAIKKFLARLTDELTDDIRQKEQGNDNTQ